MFSGFFTIFVDIFRQLLWWIMSALFFVLDTMFEVCKSLASYNLMENSTVWTYFEGFTGAFLGFFIIFRLMKRYLRSISSEDEMNHLDPIGIILKIAAAGFVIAVTPFLLRSIGKLTSLLIEGIEGIMGSANSKYSGFFLSCIGVDESVTFHDIDLQGINTKLEDGTYRYLDSMTDFLCIFISTIFSSFIMIIIAVQMGSRMLSMIMKLILAPWSISSLVEEKADQFYSWCRLLLADFMANYLQLMLLVLGGTFVLSFSPAVSGTGVTLNGIARILAMIGTLFAVLNAPAGISQLIGADLSVSSALQSLQTTMIGSSLLGAAGRMIGGAAKDAGALGTYGFGRMMGGSSIGKQLEAAIQGTEGGSNPLVSGRAPFGGIQGGIESMISSADPGITDFAAGFVSNGFPNIAKPISDLNTSSGSVRDIISNPGYSGFEKLSRMGMKVTGWGASRAYAAASNRVASFGNRGFRNYRSPISPSMMVNPVNSPASGGDSQ